MAFNLGSKFDRKFRNDLNEKINNMDKEIQSRLATESFEVRDTDPAPEELYEGRTWIANVNTEPYAPTISLSSVDRTTATVTLSTASSDLEDGTVTTYEFYVDGVLHATALNLVEGDTYQLTGLSASTTYSITAKGKDASGALSVSSSAVSATTLAPNAAPNAPVISLASVTKTSAFIQLDTASSDTEDGTISTYEIYYDGALFGTVSNWLVGETVEVTGLSTDVTYSITAKGKDSEGALSGASNPVSATPTNTAPTAGTITTSNVYDTQFTVSWSTPPSDSDGDTLTNDVLLSTDAGATWTTHASNVALPYDVTGLTSATSYDVKVATSDGTSTVDSNTASITTTAPNSEPTAPNVSTVVGSETTDGWGISLDTASTDADGHTISYSVLVSTDNWATSTTVASSLTDTSFPYTVTGQNGNTTYDYKVVATDGAANTDSNVVSVTTANTAPTAGVIATSNVTSSSFDVSFSTAPSDADGDTLTNDVYTSTDSGATWTLHQANVTLPYTVDGLTDGTTYDVKVTTSDGIESVDSNVVNVTTINVETFDTAPTLSPLTETTYGAYTLQTCHSDIDSISTPTRLEVDINYNSFNSSNVVGMGLFSPTDNKALVLWAEHADPARWYISEFDTTQDGSGNVTDLNAVVNVRADALARSTITTNTLYKIVGYVDGSNIVAELHDENGTVLDSKTEVNALSNANYTKLFYMERGDSTVSSAITYDSTNQNMLIKSEYGVSISEAKFDNLKVTS